MGFDHAALVLSLAVVTQPASVPPTLEGKPIHSKTQRSNDANTGQREGVNFTIQFL